MHLFNKDSFTRLQGAIDFCAMDLDAQADVPDYLDDVPASWKGFHHPALLAELDQRVRYLMQHPTETERHKSGHRRVQVLGGAVYDMAPDGIVMCGLWEFGHDGLMVLDIAGEDEISAEAIPYQDRWFDSFRSGLHARLMMAHGPKHHVAYGRYLDWLQAKVVGRYWRAEAATLVRGQIAAALALDDAILERARALYCAYHRGRVLLADYNRALRRFELDSRFLEDAPQLVLLHSLLAPALNDVDERTQAMKRYLLGKGVTTGMWAFLHQAGSDGLREYLPYYSAKVQPMDAAVDILRVVQAFGSDGLVPPPLVHALMTLGGHPNKPVHTARFANSLEDLFSLAGRMGHLYRVGGEGGHGHRTGQHAGAA